MPIIKSAKKRVKTSNKAAVRNSKTKRTLKSALKAFAKKASPKSHSAAQSNVDKAVKKGVMHKNKAARLKKQLATKAKADGVKHTATKNS
jgi:small subunit ribosomal protein S20